jgi:type II secretory pathway pseudopilin PulG
VFAFTQMVMVGIAWFSLLILSILAYLAVIGLLWSRRKSVEATLVWVSLWLYLIALILLLKL